MLYLITVFIKYHTPCISDYTLRYYVFYKFTQNSKLLNKLKKSEVQACYHKSENTTRQVCAGIFSPNHIVAGNGILIPVWWICILWGLWNGKHWKWWSAYQIKTSQGRQTNFRSCSEIMIQDLKDNFEWVFKFPFA